MKVVSNKRVSVSFKKSAKQTSISHNNRDLDYEQKQNQWHKHIDHDRSDLNKTLVKKDIKEMYEEIFGEAVEEYNAKQKRNDRKIKNYYSKILKNKKLEPQREFILQLGDKDDFENGDIENLSEISNNILEKYVSNFEKRNPNLKIYNAIIHNDEASPHLHLNVIPVATGYQRGVQLQPSFDKALKQQGVEFDKSDSRSLMKNFRQREVSEIENLLIDFQISRKEVGTNHIKDHHEYKKLQRELESLEEEVDEFSDDVLLLEEQKNILSEEVQLLEEKKDELAEELMETQVEQPKEYSASNIPKNKYAIISRVDFEKMKEQNELVPKVVNRNNFLEFENSILETENESLVEENQAQQLEILALQRIMEDARRHLDRLVEKGSELFNRAVTFASKFSSNESEVLPEDMRSDPKGINDYRSWQRETYNRANRER